MKNFLFEIRKKKKKKKEHKCLRRNMQRRLRRIGAGSGSVFIVSTPLHTCVSLAASLWIDSTSARICTSSTTHAWKQTTSMLNTAGSPYRCVEPMFCCCFTHHPRCADTLPKVAIVCFVAEKCTYFGDDEQTNSVSPVPDGSWLDGKGMHTHTHTHTHTHSQFGTPTVASADSALFVR